MSGSVGDNPYRASGVIAAASAGVSWQSVTTGTTLTAVAGKGYPIDTSSNVCTVTLPTSASVGDEIIFTDYARNWGTNNLTISSSLNYQGSSSVDPVYDTDGESVHIVYQDVTKGWIPIFDGAVAYETPPPTYVTATGPDDAAGVVAADDADYKVHEFTASKIAANGFAVSDAGSAGGSNTVEYVLCAGGAGGGYNRGAGGGAGGMRTATGLSVAVQNYAITIGGGGAAGSSSVSPGSDGNASTGLTIATVGGGGGGDTNAGGSDGGSGGGTTNDQGAPSIGSGTAGEGNDGGTGAAGPNYGAGGGGGKGAVGGNGTTSAAGGTGGTGLNSSVRQSGVSTGYSGGGGGGTYILGAGGTAEDGGGAGGTGVGSGSVGADGTINTGGGAGGGGNGEPSAQNGGAGGSGIMIIRYKFQN